jgi:hypothetical protein
MMVTETDGLRSHVHLDLEIRRCTEICQEFLPIQNKRMEYVEPSDQL